MKKKEIMELANTYYIGDGYTFDRIKALELYEEAIKLGSVEAVYKAAQCLEYLGKRNKNNYLKAIEYYSKSSLYDYKERIEEIKKIIKH